MDVTLPELQDVLDVFATAMIKIVVHAPDVHLGRLLAALTSELQHRWFALAEEHPGFQLTMMLPMDQWLGDDRWILSALSECDIIVRQCEIKISLINSYDRCVYTVEKISGRCLKYP